MKPVVNVITKEDKSVERRIAQTSAKLNKQLNKKRNINEKKISKPKSPLQKTISIILDVFCVICVIFGATFCFSNINCRIQNIVPTFAGYSTMKIVSGSMEKSGFEIGENVIVHSVNTHTLKGVTYNENNQRVEGDIIAFYLYAPSYNSFDINTCIKVDSNQIAPLQYHASIQQMFGIQNTEMQTAAKSGAIIVFHHIDSVYEDENGTRWFSTYGTSNSAKDVWYISENMVVGAYDSSGFAGFMSSVLTTLSSSWGIILSILVPLLLVALIIIIESGRDVHLALLECEVIEGKRKLTDPLCVKNKIGYGFSKKEKLKVLAHAEPDEKVDYIALLWKPGAIPTNIRKYYLRKGIFDKQYEEMAELNKKIKTMHEKKEPIEKISKFYLSEKEKIDKKYKNLYRHFRKLRKNYFLSKFKRKTKKKTLLM